MIKALARRSALCLLLVATATQAQYLNILGASPVSHFNEVDNKLMLAAIDKALADPAEGVAQAWSNPASPASGAVTARRSYVSEGRKCRDLLVANSYKTLKGEAVHAFCQDGTGQWKLVQ
jgi:surface antigen